MQRRISWVGSSLKDFQKFPVAVQDQIAFALRLAANGEKADSAKSMKGLGAGVFEVALRYRTNAYRAVYAVLLGDDLYVLHTFQKKAKSGIKTPKQDIDLVKARVKQVRSMLR